MRAGSASKGMGSNSLSARWSTSRRRARSACSAYSSCSSSRRTWWGPADSSARVMAVIATSAGSSSGSIHRRRIMMLVSSSPRWWLSPLIGAAAVVVGSYVLVAAKNLEVNRRGAAGHRGELPPGDVPAAAPQGDQLADAVAVAGDGERLPIFHGIHDFL